MRFPRISPTPDILIWRDVLIEGPVPATSTMNALADIRAQYIEQAFGVSDVRADFTRRDERFDAISERDELELWFESDLHDQLQIDTISGAGSGARNCHPP